MKKIVLPKEDEDLLEECRVDTYRARGKGGQHMNVTDSAVRMVHIPTGIIVTSRKGRSQFHNKQECLLKLRKKVALLNYQKPIRIPTKVPLSAKKKTKEEKQKRSKQKELRKPPGFTNE